MARLLAAALRWIARQLGLLLLIVAVLLVADWLRDAWQEHRAIRDALEAQELVLEDQRAELRSLDGAIAARQAEWRRKATDQVRAFGRELDTLNEGIREFERTARPLLTECGRMDATLRGSTAEAQRAAERVAQLEREHWWWDPVLNPVKTKRLDVARDYQARLERLARMARRQHDAAAERCRSVRRNEAQLQARRSALNQQILAADSSASPEVQRLTAERGATADDIARRERELAEQRAKIAENPRQRLIATVLGNLPVALAILAGILLLPAALKALFYFVLAPIAGRLPPIRVLATDDAQPLRQPVASAVSAALEVEPGQELLVQPDFLQSSSQPAVKRTRWFLNLRLPFASFASGMFALTSIRPEGESPTRVVVSSQRDPFGEIGVIELPAGAAMVVHPRSLAGVLKPADRPLQITRHWRLGSLHAWLTLQLRYLVFHGPCRLILKGCRGVRAEQPLESQPRLINQAATLGFSANLEYRTIRCETFVPYLRGQEALFNDLFAGGPGWFVYEEMPARGGRAGVTGRGLEGLADAFLKAFGI